MTAQELAEKFIESYGSYSGRFNDIEEEELDPIGLNRNTDLFAFHIEIKQDFEIYKIESNLISRVVCLGKEYKG